MSEKPSKWLWIGLGTGSRLMFTYGRAIVAVRISLGDRALFALSVHCHSRAKTIVHRLLQVLLATKIALRGQHRGMTEKKLNLFKLAPV